VGAWWTVFGDRKMGVLLLLGFGSGLPLLLTSKTLQAWLTQEGVDVGTIGWLGLVGVPYSLKFLWAPAIDRFALPWLGRRRGWLLALQVALMAAIAALSTQRSLTGWAIAALAVAVLGATQDMVADAYRTDVLAEAEMGAGAAVFILGYRLALLVTGSLAFVVADWLPWSQVYLLLSLALAIGMVGTVWAPEPQGIEAPVTLEAAIVQPLQEFWQRAGGRYALGVLVFVMLYRLGDSLLNAMATPFLLQAGFSQTQIGTVQGGIGLVATIVGALLGGGLLAKLGINRALWGFGTLQALSNLVYWGLSQFPRPEVLVGAIVLENFCGGLGSSAFVAYLMRLCDRRFSATQYALLSSFTAFSRDVLTSPSGELAKFLGWPLFFIVSFGAALPGLALLPWFAPWNPPAPPEKS